MKKIVCICVVLMFLFTSLTTVSAINIKSSKNEISPEKKSVVEKSEDLPDLTINLLFYEHSSYWELSDVFIHNNGTALIPAYTPIIFRITEYTGVLDYWVKAILYIDIPAGTSIHIPLICSIGFKKFYYRGKYVKATVDPLPSEYYPWPELNPDPEYGIIKESNEDNNTYTHVFPKSSSRSTKQRTNHNDNLKIVNYEHLINTKSSHFLSKQDKFLKEIPIRPKILSKILYIIT